MQVNGTPFGLVGEIDRGALASILKNVELKDIGADPAPDARKLSEAAAAKYMEPVRFAEFVVRAPDVLPSERYTYLIREKKGADAYLRLLHAIWKYGIRNPIDEGGADVKEIRDAVVVIERRGSRRRISS